VASKTTTHGVGAEHDRQVNRTGAYAETCLAVQRAHAVGLRAGCNVFLTTANAGQAERLLGVLQRLEVDQMWWGPATYYPTARGRRNERLRPALSELLPLADRIRTLSPFDHDVWANLAAHTEAAWGRRALADDWPPFTRHAGEVLELVCRPNLDLHTAPPAGTTNGTATCAPTVRGRRWPARSRKVGGPWRRGGLVPIRCRRPPS
jgi:MoaA/NifB/PqqE/SkfB family radical SAM enzyme